MALALAPAPASAQTVRTVSLLANDLAYDATRQRIYASVPDDGQYLYGGVAIFDNGVALPAVTQAHTGSNAIEFGATPDRLYGYNTETTESGFRRLSVTATGVSEVDVSPDLFDPFTRDMVFEAGRIYGSGGPGIDAESRTVLGTFTGVTVGGTPQVRPATDRGAVHFLTGSVLRTYHAQTFVPPGAPFTVPGAGDETRWLIRVVMPPGNWTCEVTLLSPERGRTYARSVWAFVVP